jgi:hypothetical protein
VASAAIPSADATPSEERLQRFPVRAAARTEFHAKLDRFDADARERSDRTQAIDEKRTLPAADYRGYAANPLGGDA